jgi:hypothetical protein
MDIVILFPVPEQAPGALRLDVNIESGRELRREFKN